MKNKKKFLSTLETVIYGTAKICIGLLAINTIGSLHQFISILIALLCIFVTAYIIGTPMIDFLDKKMLDPLAKWMYNKRKERIAKKKEESKN